MWNARQGMASGQPEYAPPPYGMVVSTPAHGQPQPEPPSYSESAYGQNYSAHSSYSHLPHAPIGQGYNVPAESNIGSRYSRPSTNTSLNGGRNMQTNHEFYESQDSHRHHGIIGRILHGHHDSHEHHGHHDPREHHGHHDPHEHHRHHDSEQHGHHEHHGDHERHHHDHHRHHGLLGLFRHHSHHNSHED
ncbi:hypothetical protein GDO78_002696 [Eleutherodactylus coqui]|uniref:Uncharacterized protein n=1 Tax=Eleutherodactylus coqui TaxID=57060 RepID=A0A8J6EZ18_ELECQ|nr:hypothetical protein GDO78_002696 [Eleutherodactylus coqui]